MRCERIALPSELHPHAKNNSKPSSEDFNSYFHQAQSTQRKVFVCPTCVGTNRNALLKKSQGITKGTLLEAIFAYRYLPIGENFSLSPLCLCGELFLYDAGAFGRREFEEVVLESFFLDGVSELESGQTPKEVVDLDLLDVKGSGGDRQIDVIDVSP